MADEETPSDAPANEPDPTPDPPAEVPSDLGDAGKAAIKAERDHRKKAEREAADLRKRLEAIEAENLSETEKAIAAARDEGRSEALTLANTRLLQAEIRAAAAGKIADPADAIKLLDLSEFEVTDGGEVDTEAIASAIDALVEAKPYLAATVRPLGTGGGGARPQAPALSRDQQIAEAEAKGDYRTATHLKNQVLREALYNTV